VVAAVGRRLPKHRFIAGAGPQDATIVIAVASRMQMDADIISAVRDGMGGCVVYTGGAVPTGSSEERTSGQATSKPVALGPGVTVVDWSEGPISTDGLDRLTGVLTHLWVDRGRWMSDVHRADADRADRVRVAVRLGAEQLAAVLLNSTGDGAGPQLASTSEGRRSLDELFRAHLRCAVLDQGVEWPHLRDIGMEDSGTEDAELGEADPQHSAAVPWHREDLLRWIITAGASLGAGVASWAALTRLAGPVVGVLCGAVIAVFLGTLRWRAMTVARRERSVVRGCVALRRGWTVTVTEVIARLRVPSVADALTRELDVLNESDERSLR